MPNPTVAASIQYGDGLHFNQIFRHCQALHNQKSMGRKMCVPLLNLPAATAPSKALKPVTTEAFVQAMILLNAPQMLIALLQAALVHRDGATAVTPVVSFQTVLTEECPGFDDENDLRCQVFYGQNDPNVDYPAIFNAVNVYEKVILDGTFDFGSVGNLQLTVPNVTLQGEAGSKIYNGRITVQKPGVKVLDLDLECTTADCVGLRVQMSRPANRCL